MALNSYTLGSLVRTSATFRNLAGTLTDPTTVTCTVTKPDGTQTVETYNPGDIVKSSTGVYYLDITTDADGVWYPLWAGAGNLVIQQGTAFLVVSPTVRWTYSGNPTASNKDAVRFLIQDTVEANQLANDDEILWALTQQANLYLAAALVARAIGARFSGKATVKQVGDLRIEHTDTAKRYFALADSLAAQAGTVGGLTAPYFGGWTVSGKQGDEQNTDRVTPAFRVNQFDRDRAGSNEQE